jgi:hypothetical protein
MRDLGPCTNARVAHSALASAAQVVVSVIATAPPSFGGLLLGTVGGSGFFGVVVGGVGTTMADSPFTRCGSGSMGGTSDVPPVVGAVVAVVCALVGFVGFEVLLAIAWRTGRSAETSVSPFERAEQATAPSIRSAATVGSANERALDAASGREGTEGSFAGRGAGESLRRVVVGMDTMDTHQLGGRSRPEIAAIRGRVDGV